MAKVSINKREIARMMRDMQKEFDKHPIRVPVQADTPSLPPTDLERYIASGGASQGTTIYNGPVIQGSADGAQLAWNNTGEINQQQSRTEQVAPGFEAIAQAVTLTLQGLPAAGLEADDLRDAEEAANEALTEVTQEQPDRGRVRRAVTALKGALAPIAAGLSAAASTEVQEWARTAIDQLGAAL